MPPAPDETGGLTTDPRAERPSSTRVSAVGSGVPREPADGRAGPAGPDTAGDGAGTGLAALLARDGRAAAAFPAPAPRIDVTQVGEEVAPAAPLEPQAGQQPDQIVRGFIAATRADATWTPPPGSPFGAARQYLTPDAQAGWQPGPLRGDRAERGATAPTSTRPSPAPSW